MTCSGSLDGKDLAGEPGRFYYEYAYDGSDTPIGANFCGLSGGHGRWEVSLPAADGTTVDLHGPFSFIYLGAAPGVGEGELGEHIAYQGQAFTPPEGHWFDQNCVTHPVFTGDVFGPFLIY